MRRLFGFISTFSFEFIAFCLVGLLCAAAWYALDALLGLLR